MVSRDSWPMKEMFWTISKRIKMHGHVNELV